MPLYPLSTASVDETEHLLGADLPVARVISRQLLTCAPTTPLHEAARRMREGCCSSILVVQEGDAVGIWSERDALRIDFQDPASFNTPIERAMSAPVKSVPGETPLREAALRMREEHVRHLLVTDGEGRARGIVSQTDVVLNQGIEYFMRLRTVKSLLKRELIYVSAAITLSEAVEVMREGGVDALVVRFEEGEFGIVTERDIVACVAKRRACSIGQTASRPLITVDEETSLYLTRSIMVENRIRHIGVVDGGGGLKGIIGFSDVLEGIEFAYVHELQNALRDSSKALKASRRSLLLAEKIIEHSPEGIMVTDRNKNIVSVNPAFTRLTGYRPEEVVGRKPSLLSSGRHGPGFYSAMWERINREGEWRGEVWNRRKSGELFPELLTITAITDEGGDVTHYAALFSDISELKENEERIKQLAYFDPLTGLPNRRLFQDRLSVALAHAKRNRQRLAVLFVDLDRFKRINDSLGHGVGDELLTEVANRMKLSLREDDTVARTGGDEFIILLPEVAGADDAVHVARRVIDSLEAPIAAGGEDLNVSCSIGIAIYPDDGHDPSTLIKNADTAMYRAKDAGRNSYQLYTPAMNARTLEHLAMETSLAKALERGELQVYYQPLVPLRPGAPWEAEALLRWFHSAMGVISPTVFIPLAEESGLILRIGEWVLREVCRQTRLWHEQGVPVGRVAVNVSPRQFRHEEFLPTVRRILAEEGAYPAWICFEVTESLLMESGAETIERLKEIRAMGIEIAVDDFGTGYSSLAYLKRFPINVLKIDRSFVREIETAVEDMAIVSAVISLGHSLRLQVVAEGVENGQQLALLERNGCDVVQGFHYSPPLPVGEFERVLGLWRTLSEGRG